MYMKKLLIVCGPTATGKTSLAIYLAKQFNGELISADSRQVYKRLDVITGKDLPESRQLSSTSYQLKYQNKQYTSFAYVVDGVPLWLYDVVAPNEKFSVGVYAYFGKFLMDEISKRNKLPIVVGGTGLYLKALTSNLGLIHIPPNKGLRAKLARLAVDDLQEYLAKLNPARDAAMNVSDRQNPRRLIRAIEIVRWQREHRETPQEIRSPFEALWIGLTAPMAVLEERIKKRVAVRWERAVEEVQKLKDLDLSQAFPAVTSLGIVAIQAFLTGQLSETEAQEAWWRAERAYAKRQLTWFKKQEGIHRFNITSDAWQEEVAVLVKGWYTNS